MQSFKFRISEAENAFAESSDQAKHDVWIIGVLFNLLLRCIAQDKHYHRFYHHLQYIGFKE